MKPLIIFLSCAGTALAGGRLTAPAGCVTVKAGGSIQSAVNSLSTSSTAAQCIFIEKGTYHEQVLVSPRRAQLTIYGQTDDTSSYHGNQVTITSSKSQKDNLSNDETGTLRIKANNFKGYNLNVFNDFGEGSQAIALSVAADAGFYGCKFSGYQDTVLVDSGKQFFSRCDASGATDFIFGQFSQSVFHKCDIRCKAPEKRAYISAHGRNSSSSSSFFLFDECDVAASEEQPIAPTGSCYLGRPWGLYARVVFQKTSMSAVLNPAGWSVWSTKINNEVRTEHAYFGESHNTGVGAASGQRANFSTQNIPLVPIAQVLGSNYANEPFFDSAFY